MRSEARTHSPASSEIPLASQQQADFNRIFDHELLKSELRRTQLMLALGSLALVLGLIIMLLGEEHFTRIGDHGKARFWLLGLVLLYLLYQFSCYQILQSKIRRNQPRSDRLALFNAFFDPSILTAWLLVEALMFEPGAMFESPISYAYLLMILYSALQLSWRLCLLTGLISALEYLLLVAWYSWWMSASLPQNISSYMPVHGMRAAILLVGGAVTAFIAYEIRTGIRQTLNNLRERDFVVSVFGRYLSDDVVDNILRSPEGLRLGGKRRTLTVMMTDLRGFTSLSENLPPESVIAILNHYLACMTEVIVRYRGTIDEFIGDAILAIFGAPLSAEDDADRAVACALEMQLAMKAVNEWNQARGFPVLEMGIGIHTGPLVVGNIGSEKRSKYGVVGSTVNLTSRIESYTIGGEVLVSQATLQQLKSQPEVQARRTVHPKGYTEAIEISSITGIEGLYTARLQPESNTLHILAKPLPIRLRPIEGKDISTTAFEGELLAISDRLARIRCPEALASASNLSLELTRTGDPPGKLLAKVITGQSGPEACEAELYLSAVPPEMTAFFKTL